MKRMMLTAVVAVLACGCGGPRAALKIVDGDTGRPVPARVRLRDADGKDHVVPGAQVVVIGKRDRWFVTDGLTSMSVDGLLRYWSSRELAVAGAG